MNAASFLEGMGLGGSLIIAISAQNAFVLRQGLKRQSVFLVTTVCILCDCALIALGSAGVGTLIASSQLLTSIATWGGALFLLAYGARAFRAALKPGALHTDEAAPVSSGRMLMTVLAVSLLNPHVYLDTVVLLGSIAGRHEGAARLAFALGAMLASTLWFYGIGYGARVLAPVLARPAAWRAIDLLVGLVMWTIAFTLIYGAVRGGA